MWDWLLWGKPVPPKPKHLSSLADSLLAKAGPLSGESPFPCTEKELKRLCGAAREALLKEPSLIELSTNSSVVVVGDLHGQFSDLQRIFRRLGRPGSDGKVWVFLGDYIDRGPMGLEIVVTLLALKLRHPQSIYLLRGNHECSEITVLFGFCGECQRRSTLAVWEAVMQVFDALPLAALLNGRVFLCHGGISPYLTRPQDVNTIHRPLDVNPNGEGLLADLLWADPSPHVEGWCPNPRGVSYLFGLDVARQWLAAQGLRAIVRAHMVQQSGFEVLGDNEVMTVFSASDYRESGNTGAVLVIAPNLAFQFELFQPSNHMMAGAFGVEDAAAAAAAAGAGAGQAAGAGLGSKFGSPLPAERPESAAAAVPPRTLPFGAGQPGAAEQRAGAGPGEAAAAAAAGEAPTPAAQALQEEVEEDAAVIKKVASDENLAQMVRKPSVGLRELEELTGGSRVPAEALARTSSQGSGRMSPRALARSSSQRS